VKRPPKYRRDCLRVLSLLLQSGGMTREAMATKAQLSVTGATARARELRKYGCDMVCKQIRGCDFPVWIYSCAFAPDAVRKAAAHE